MAKFGVTRGKSTPMVVVLKLHKFDKDEPDVDEPFRSLVGHLTWLANQTRPYIRNAVSAVARYSVAPKYFISRKHCASRCASRLRARTVLLSGGV